jgi:hypothetical protein
VIDRKISRALCWGDFTVTGDGKINEGYNLHPNKAPVVRIDEKAIDLLSTSRVPESARQEAKAMLTADRCSTFVTLAGAYIGIKKYLKEKSK